MLRSRQLGGRSPCSCFCQRRIPAPGTAWQEAGGVHTRGRLVPPCPTSPAYLQLYKIDHYICLCSQLYVRRMALCTGSQLFAPSPARIRRTQPPPAGDLTTTAASPYQPSMRSTCGRWYLELSSTHRGRRSRCRSHRHAPTPLR